MTTGSGDILRDPRRTSPLLPSGWPSPWLVTPEWLHYLYAIVLLAGLIVLRPGFTGRSRTWWDVALAIQVWHHFEHALLLGQPSSASTCSARRCPPASSSWW